MKWPVPWWKTLILVVAIPTIIFFWPNLPSLFSPFGISTTDEIPSYLVQRRTLEDRAIERGTVESQNTVYGRCELPTSGKITFIVPEGEFIKKGDKVVNFESNEFETQIRQKEVEANSAKGKVAEAEQLLEIKKNENETNIAAAKLEYEIAEIDLRKYLEGDLLAEVSDLERAIKEAEAQLEEVVNEKINVEVLVKKGYRTPQQLRGIQLREITFQFQVERDRQKLKNLLTFEKEKKLIELRGKEAETKLKWDRSQQTANAELKKAEGAVENAGNELALVEANLGELKKMLEKCTMYAEQDGILAYANERWFDASRRIREGTEVWSGRNIYYLPDLVNMQVVANIHESIIDRVKIGQPVRIRLDAFPEARLKGTVHNVANMAGSSYTSIQNYQTIILIDELPTDISVKPGMTAEVNILVGTYENVVAVPIGAVTEHFGQSYVYVMEGIPSTVQRRRVSTGRFTHSFVEISKGLEPGEQVALDAYARGIQDFAKQESQVEQTVRPDAATPPGMPGIE